MEDSILKSTKTMLGVDDNLTAFDLEIITHVNSAFSGLSQIGIGDATPVEDVDIKWSDLPLTPKILNMVKTLIFLKVKKAFDPPATSFHIEALNDQIREQEWRLNTMVENEAEEVESV